MRPILSLLSSFVFGGLAVGCGPSISREVHDARAFRTSERCTQGPLEFTTRAEGARWGEGIELVACTPRAIHGRYEVSMGEARVRSGEYGRIMHHREDRTAQGGHVESVGVSRSTDAPDNARCVASDAELSQVATTSGGEAVAPSAAAAGPATAAADSPAAPTVELHEVTSPGASVDSYSLCDAPGLSQVDIADVEIDSVDANAELRVRIWSLEPNDLEGVFFVLRRFVMRPSVSDAEWQAHLDEEQREREQQAREAQAEADEYQRHCAAHHEDEDCWGEGGYDAREAREERARREWVARGSPRPAAEPVRRDPSGPPPAALAEERPPAPSANADWVPGYWNWSGTAWGWLAGRWRVPDTDITAGLTTHAPTAPPAPRTDDDQPPSPAPGAVWCNGHWQWAGAAFVWVKGSWQLPPRAGATWVGATWRIGGGGAVFVPGLWR